MATYDDMMRAAKQQALWQGLMGLGGQMLQGGDPRQPQSFGAGLGRGVQAFGQGYQNAFSNQLQSEMGRLKFAEADRQKALDDRRQQYIGTLPLNEQPAAEFAPEAYFGAKAKSMYPPPLRGRDRYVPGPNGHLVDTNDPQAVHTANASVQGGMYLGEGIDAQVMNAALRLRPKIENGTATNLERQAYQLAMERMQKPMTYTDPMTGGLVSRPGMPLTGFPGAGSAPAPAMGAGAPVGMPAAPVGSPAPAATGPGITDVSKKLSDRNRLASIHGEDHPAVQALDREIQNTAQPNAGKVQENKLNAIETLASLNSINASYKPEYLTFGYKWNNLVTSVKDKAGFTPDPNDRQALNDFTTFRRDATSNLSKIIKNITGATMGETEAARIISEAPNAGTGLFDGDGPTEFKAKLDASIKNVRRSIIRYNMAINKGLNPLDSGMELADVDAMVNRRGQEIEKILRSQNPNATSDAIQLQVDDALMREFGLN